MKEVIKISEYKLQVCTKEEIKKLIRKTYQSKINDIPIIGKVWHEVYENKLFNMIEKEVSLVMNDKLQDILIELNQNTNIKTVPPSKSKAPPPPPNQK